MDIYRSHVLVCAGTGCEASNSTALRQALRGEIARAGLEREVRVVETGCFGFCRFGPNMVIYPEGVFYCEVQLEDVRELVEEHLLKGRVVKRLLYREPDTSGEVVDFGDIEFFAKQRRVVLANCGAIDPESIDEYIARDGYFALAKALGGMEPAAVVKEIKQSGLRGRGGGGFPTGLKWEFTARAPGKPKYVVCNADEGDPGAFMDRSILEGDPHSVLEGMVLAGYAVGANQGYVYVRAEYPIAVHRLELALAQARARGLLGRDILGSGFDFDLALRLGAGAFVCGEETALLESIMGRRGEPRPRPPFPASSGLWGKPTVLNNVETLANVPVIIRRGADWFASIGTQSSKGTKVFALAGAINNNGLVEVPMGTTLGDIIFDIGGGIPRGRRFKAAQTGGPSGGCIPVQHLNTPIDYESLQALGTIMGSGGLIVMDEDTCMVDLAKFFLEFVQDESCGKCVPCRVGTRRMLEVLKRITGGEGRDGDIELLLELGESIKRSALCGLGQTAPNPVLSTIRYFRDEYEQHIREKKCPASVCASLFRSPCQNTCPAQVDVPVYVDLVAQGRYLEAYETIRRQNPLPVVCGRVCHHPCEARCRRGQLDEPVAIRALKRFAADHLAANGGLPAPRRVSPTGKRVAVIGSGPAGLTAAYYLAGRGHEVTVFEALPVAGGMLTVGIPEYRLPKSVLQREVAAIASAGVSIQTNQALGRDFTLADLKQRGYGAVYLATGAHRDQRLGIAGEDTAGVYAGVEFLRRLNLGEELAVRGEHVVVVGGGNVAIDAARSALRLGAESVTIVYRRDRAAMPAEPPEIEEALTEGVKLVTLANPVRVVATGGRLSAVRCVRMRSVEFDATGRRRTVPVEDSEFELRAGVMIAAIGQTPDSALLSECGLELGAAGRVLADQAGATSVPGLFAGGDCVTGPATVVAAIQAGKLAAAAIDRHLGGDGSVVLEPAVERVLGSPVCEDRMPRESMPSLELCQRLGFAEVETGYTEQAARREARRCLRCDVQE
jgi:NADH-quinone oxidoreductase subunit F